MARPPITERPIGVFDSGVGGLTVFKALAAAVPERPLVYLGDTARVPYGTRSPETVVRYSLEAARFLMGHHIGTLVVACNTASSVAIEPLREATGIPVLGVIGPGARRAVAQSAGGRIGVIGTRATIDSGAYRREILKLRADAEVVSHACPLFVPLAEEGWTAADNAVALGVAETYLAGLRERQVDTLVLGCTHYPLLRGVIARVMGDGVRIVDSAESVAGEIRSRVGDPLDGEHDASERHRFFVTDVPGPFQAVAERFLGREIPRLEQVRLGA